MIPVLLPSIATVMLPELPDLTRLITLLSEVVVDNSIVAEGATVVPKSSLRVSVSPTRFSSTDNICTSTVVEFL